MNSAEFEPKSVLIVGCGDIGRRVAAQWQSVPVAGLVRSKASAEALQQAGITPWRADLDDPASLQDLPVADALVYYFAPPTPTGTTDPRMQHFLAAIDPTHLPSRIVYISTSGVYGDRGGEIVNEDTPPNPQVDRARRRYDAEQQLQDFGQEHGVAVIILRVGGIYGPGRLPVKRLQDRVPIIHEHLAPSTNRIHADDLAQICVAAARRGRADTVYNVSDGTNSNMTEYFNTVADFLKLPRPPTIDWDEAEHSLSAGMLSYLKESRRMDNRRMLEELGVELQYPTLEAGLAAMESGTEQPTSEETK
ncbi:MAG: SDR family oxidoreductase [Gammaproteobacteria bacterium]|nr:SDR family oxidoreductase [Gammaproteobacteria bacterium]